MSLLTIYIIMLPVAFYLFEDSILLKALLSGFLVILGVWYWGLMGGLFTASWNTGFLFIDQHLTGDETLFPIFIGLSMLFAVLFGIKVVYNDVFGQGSLLSQTREELKESEAKFMRLANSAQDAVIMVDGLGKISFWNKGAIKMLGFREDEALDKELDSLISADKRIADQFAAYKQGQEEMKMGKTHETSIIIKDKKEIPVEITVSATTYKQKWHSLLVIRDISERKEAERKLRHQKEHFKALFKDSTDAIVFIDSEHKIRNVNRRFEELFGYSMEECLGKDANQLLVGAQQQKEKFLCTYSFSTEQQVELEAVRYAKGGEAVEVQIKSVPVIIDGEVLGIYAIYSDISARRAAENALLESECRYGSIVTLLSDVLLCFDKDGNIVDVIAKNRELFTANMPSELKGKCVSEIFPEHFAELLQKNIEKSRQTWQLQSFEASNFEVRMIACGQDQVIAIIRCQS